MLPVSPSPSQSPTQFSSASYWRAQRPARSTYLLLSIRSHRVWLTWTVALAAAEPRTRFFSCSFLAACCRRPLHKSQRALEPRGLSAWLRSVAATRRRQPLSTIPSWTLVVGRHLLLVVACAASTTWFPIRPSDSGRPVSWRSRHHRAVPGWRLPHLLPQPAPSTPELTHIARCHY